MDANLYFWCPTCQRAYRDGQQRGARPFRLCAYSNCNSMADLAEIAWPRLRKAEPTLPEIPALNTPYSFDRVVMQSAW